jgi:hypothetical protein
MVSLSNQAQRFFVARSGFMPSKMTAFTNPGVCE